MLFCFKYSKWLPFTLIQSCSLQWSLCPDTHLSVCEYLFSLFHRTVCTAFVNVLLISAVPRCLCIQAFIIVYCPVFASSLSSSHRHSMPLKLQRFWTKRILCVCVCACTRMYAFASQDSGLPATPHLQPRGCLAFSLAVIPVKNVSYVSSRGPWKIKLTS